MKFLNSILTLCVGYTVYYKGAPLVLIPTPMIEFEPEYEGQTIDDLEAGKPYQVLHYTVIALHWFRARIYLKWVARVEVQTPIKFESISK